VETLPLSISTSNVLAVRPFPYNSIWFAGIYVRGCIPKLFFGKSHYEGGKKYLGRCEVYYCYDGAFCLCCGMALRMSPTSKRDKERLRQLQLRREEQDRIIRIIKGTK